MLNLLIEKIKCTTEESKKQLNDESIKICTCTPDSDTCLNVAELLEGKECGCKTYVDINEVNKELDKIIDYLNKLNIK